MADILNETEFKIQFILNKVVGLYIICGDVFSKNFSNGTYIIFLQHTNELFFLLIQYMKKIDSIFDVLKKLNFSLKTSFIHRKNKSKPKRKSYKPSYKFLKSNQKKSFLEFSVLETLKILFINYYNLNDKKTTYR